MLSLVNDAPHEYEYINVSYRLRKIIRNDM